MLYIIKGTFINGEKWEDRAHGYKDLYYYLRRIFANKTISEYKIYNKKGEDVTSKFIREDQ